MNNKTDLLISTNVNKDPYEKILTNHKIINLTGESGSGKSYFAKQEFSSNEYIIIDTDKVILDKTPESLIGLWEWFQTKISWEEKTREEIELELKGRPEWMTQIILADTKKIADLTLKLAYDIGMYFGEVFVENNSSLYWGIKTKPKALNGVNQPNVLGFLGDVNMYAYGIVQVAIRKEHKETKVTRLFDIYNTWLDMNVKN